MLPELRKKDANVIKVAKKALRDEKTLLYLLGNLTSKEETIRYNSSKVLSLISQEQPEVLYPRWDEFVDLMGSENTYHKCAAISIIANLTRADAKNKFEKIFDSYYGLLDDKSIITAVYVARNSWKIARAKPNLQSKITKKLCRVDETHHEPERRDLIKSDVIESFNEYFEEAEDKKKILNFVKKQLESKSPKTRKAAKEFLTRWSKS